MAGLPGYDVLEGRDLSDAVDVNGAQHMDLIKEKMKDIEYDKDHKPNPSGKLDVFTNMFIDQIQGNISKSTMKTSHFSIYVLWSIIYGVTKT